MTSQDYSALFSGFAALVALGALVATIVFGVKNLRQSRRGPDREPAWSLVRSEDRSVALTNELGAGTAYDVNIVPPKTPGFRGDTYDERVAAGQRIRLVIKFTSQTPRSGRALTVNYRCSSGRGADLDQRRAMTSGSQ